MKIKNVFENGNMAYFSHGGNLYYTVNVGEDKYLFYVNTDSEEVGTATFSNEIKAITLMRWINKCMKSEEFIKIN